MTSLSSGEPSSSQTLSWREARNILRECCETYLQTSVNTVLKSERKATSTPFFLSLSYKWNLDIIIGGLGTSVSLLIITMINYVKSQSPSQSLALSQLVSASLLLSACIFNIWLMVRYKYSASQGTDNLKRRIISRFLKELLKQDEDSTENLGKGFFREDNSIDLVGTSLTGIYPVYRLSQDVDGKICGASWSRVPNLLLVEGDKIALQIGDCSPAKCRVLQKESSVVFEIGETISLESCNETVDTIIGRLPKGRTTIQNDSNELLKLCNDMRIFEVLETPLVKFLRETEHESKSPQIFRQLEAIRGILSFTGCVVFLLTLFILLGRYRQFTSDIFYLMPSPFIAALGSFPLIGPGCLIFIECLGSARILTSYHPVASLVREEASAEEAAKTNVDVLIVRYLMATLSNRLSLQKVGRNLDRLTRRLMYRNNQTIGSSSLVRVPPASLNLLEKLGVATAFALVDDELVCESQAIPQQLLIPSGQGLKLLDLCPTYEDDSDDDGEGSRASEQNRNKQRSFDEEKNYDSDSDSDDALKDHHHVPSGKKTRRRLLRRSFHLSAQRKREAEEEKSDSELADHEVQFEDPSWWQHLPSLKCIGLGCILVEQKDELTGRIGSSQFVANEDSSFAGGKELECCRTALVNLVCKERRSVQLRSLAQCIGFSTKPSASGNRGDASPFKELHRLHVVSATQLKERLKIDSHERGSEESRWWNLLRSDATSIIVQDSRSGAYQLLTVGDPRVVTRMCHEVCEFPSPFFCITNSSI